MKKLIEFSLGLLFPASARTGQDAPDMARAPLPVIQEQLASTLHDCDSSRSHRLAQRVHSARTASELWALRSDVHQCIAQIHNQAEASNRINGLATAFRGWVPERQLNPI
jgi:hypothetical protein